MFDSKEKILVTGCAGFIGMHLCRLLLSNGKIVFGVDNLNNYYDPNLKIKRLSVLKKFDNFFFEKNDITNYSSLKKIVDCFSPKKIVNLAAQAGVRYSLESPQSYIDDNIVGFMNILECSRYNSNINGVIYASSSSVYGGNNKIPFSVLDRVDKPLSIYAVTKRANELMAHSYSHLYGLNTTGLRFFSVYGSWGRPDMALFKFANKIIKNQEISVYNHGEMQRDFTHINDIVIGLAAAINKNYLCEIFNLGKGKNENLMKIISLLETSLNKKARIKFLGMQKGDVKLTCADIQISKEKLGFNPEISIEQGVSEFCDWYLNYIKA
jgi:UDP-glucuronate 4-epimerase